MRVAGARVMAVEAVLVDASRDPGDAAVARAPMQFHVLARARDRSITRAHCGARGYYRGGAHPVHTWVQKDATVSRCLP